MLCLHDTYQDCLMCVAIFMDTSDYVDKFGLWIAYGIVMSMSDCKLS